MSLATLVEQQTPPITSFSGWVADQLWERLSPKLQEVSGKLTVWPRLLEVDAGARYIGRIEAAVRQLIHKGELIVVRRGGRVHLDRSDLERWIESNKV